MRVLFQAEDYSTNHKSLHAVLSDCWSSWDVLIE